MRSHRAVLRDIHDYGLDPSVAHKQVAKAGRLRVTDLNAAAPVLEAIVQPIVEMPAVEPVVELDQQTSDPDDEVAQVASIVLPIEEVDASDQADATLADEQPVIDVAQVVTDESVKLDQTNETVPQPKKKKKERQV